MPASSPAIHILAKLALNAWRSPRRSSAGAGYFPGQQLRVIVGGLNLRESPSTNAEIVELLLSGDYVAVFAGPYDDNDGNRWWQVQTARDRFGWVAGRIKGNPTVGPA